MPEYIVEASSIDDFGGFYRAQLPPIVRCEDCRYFVAIRHIVNDSHVFQTGACALLCRNVRQSDYCAWGEYGDGDV